MIGYLNKIYDAVANGGDTSELETAIEELKAWVQDFEANRSITDADTSKVYKLIESNLLSNLDSLITNGQTTANYASMGLMYVSDIPWLRLWVSMMLNEEMLVGNSVQSDDVLAITGKHIRFTSDEEMEEINEKLDAAGNGGGGSSDSGGSTGSGVTVISENNYEVMETRGTVLETKLTPTELLSAVESGGVELHVLTDDQVDWYIFQLYDVGTSGDYANFQRTDGDSVNTVSIDVAEDGTMTVAFVDSKEIGGSSSTDTGVTIITETNYEVRTTKGTVLDTKMTPAQFVEAAKGGIELHIPFEDAEDSDLEVYHLGEYSPDGTYAFFTQSTVGSMNTIHINIDTDGTMTVGNIYSYSIPKGVTKKTLWSGSASSGTVITLSDSLANYDYFVVQGFYGSTSYIFNISGVYSPTGYKGAGVNANGVFYSTGGFYYDITINITNSGSWSYYVGAKNSTSSFSSSLTLMQIIGYKFNT